MVNIYRWYVLMQMKLESGASWVYGWPDALKFVREEINPKGTQSSTVKAVLDVSHN